MKMLISSAWLQKKIETEPDVDVGIGAQVESAETTDSQQTYQKTSDRLSEDLFELKLKNAYSLLIKNLRRAQKLSIEQLASRAEIDENELISIENDPTYATKPRTVHQLSEFFNVDKRRLAILAGSIKAYDESFNAQALNFAAKSNGVSVLNKDEQEILNEFVKYLNKG